MRLRWILAIGFCALLAASGRASAQGIAYYVDSTIGNDNNDGLAPDRPLQSLDHLQNLYGHLIIAPGTLYLAGDHIGAFDFVNTKANVRQWPGHAPARIRGSRDPIAEGRPWILSAPGTYRCAIGPNRQVRNVCAKWASLFAQLGKTAGWYRVGTVTDGALATNERYAYDPDAGFLYFRDDAVGDPNLLSADDRVWWQDGTLQIGLDVRDQTNHALPILTEGITFLHFNTGVGVSYGMIDGGTNHTIQDCTFFDCEQHSIVISNFPNINNRCVRCVAYGAGAGAIGTMEFPSLYVTHSPVQDPAADIVGCRFINCISVCYGLQDPHGDPLDPVDYINGFYGHTYGDGGGTVNDVEWDSCASYHDRNPGIGFYCGDTAPVPDPYDWASYPVRGVDCITINCASMTTFSNVAFKRCFFDLSQFPRFGIYSGPGSFSVHTSTVNLLEACILIADTSNDGFQQRSVYRMHTGARLIRTNCTTINLAGSHSSVNSFIQPQDGWSGFVSGASGFLSESYACLDVYLNNNPTNACYWNDSIFSPLSGPGNSYISDGCWITGVAPGRYSQNSTIASAAAFTALLEHHAVLDINPQFVNPLSVDPAVAGTLLPGSPVLTTTYTPAHHAPIGYNGLNFAGQRGAIQSGTPFCACDRNTDGAINSQDFFAFLADFFNANADFNHDGATNTQDFFDFLACFFTGC